MSLARLARSSLLAMPEDQRSRWWPTAAEAIAAVQGCMVDAAEFWRGDSGPRREGNFYRQVTLR